MFLNSKDRFVPKFVGGSLPRKDAGNREDYCAVMLMLFKPWRTGKDLKEEGYGWDATLNAHEFTEQQTQLMKFFHIRYECNDARDDHAAQKKARLLQAKLAMHFEEEMPVDFLDKYASLDQLEHDVSILDQENNLDQQTDAYYQNKARAVNLNAHLKNIDALNESQYKIDINHTTQPVHGESKPAQVWKALLTQLKDNILQGRYAQAAKKKPGQNGGEHKSEVDEVKTVNKSYLTQSFRASDPADRAMIDEIVDHFTLNEKQERAFRIVANHAVEDSGDQLLTYLGGIAGTGKSQVIKALIELYTRQGEEYRFQCLAPTGTATALIGGSTYHSVLGMSQYTVNKSDSIQKKAQIYDRLKNIDYIFIDEVSMIDCKALNKISAKMCTAMAEYQKPFGGKHVILAGDFAQLPPVSRGSALYSHKVKTVVHTKNGLKQHEETMDKFIWHHFTTVVILRQNMRQRTQTKMDAKFRTLLENLHYKSCIQDDIDLLRTCIAKQSPNSPKMTDPNFKYVSVIV